MANTVQKQDDLSPAVMVRTRISELLADAPMDTGEDGLANLLIRLSNAETIEDAAAVFSKMDNSITVADVPLMVTGFVLRESEYGGELPFYATVFATHRNTGAEITFNVGATAMVMTLLVANRRGWFPFTAHVERKKLSKPADDGSTRIVSNLIFDA